MSRTWYRQCIIRKQAGLYGEHIFLLLPTLEFRPKLGINPDIGFRDTATWQNFVRSDKGQRLFEVLHLAVKQAHPAHAAIASPALVFDFMACALQAIEQGFLGNEVKAGVLGTDFAQSSKSPKSSLLTSESIWPMR